jgi:hypothetical protein
MDIPYGLIGWGASQNHLKVGIMNQTSGQVRIIVTTSRCNNQRQSGKPVPGALKHCPMCGTVPAGNVPFGNIGWEGLFLRLPGRFRTRTGAGWTQTTMNKTILQNRVFSTMTRNHIMNQPEQFQMLLKNAADGLGVPEKTAMVMLIAAASTLPPDVIRVLASLAKRQADDGVQ